MDIDTILINAARTQASHIPHERMMEPDFHQLPYHLETIPNEDHTIILEGCPDDSISSLMDFMPPPLEGAIGIPSLVTRDRTSVHKVHFGNQADDQTAATKSTGGTSQLNLIDYINNHLGVDFDTLQVQVAAR
jgi:hypothetical protein